jgi:hypothetical protein
MKLVYKIASFDITDVESRVSVKRIFFLIFICIQWRYMGDELQYFNKIKN